MKKNIFILLAFIIGIVMLHSCDSENNETEVDIMYKSVDVVHVFIRDTAEVGLDDSPESMHIDSIINGLIDAELVSTGLLSYDLNQDSQFDISFEILDLKPYNDNFPASFDSLAVRAHATNLEFLDNSTYCYADALNQNDTINADGNWTSQSIVLGTFMNAGNFNGQGNKFLAFRLLNSGNYKYGWIKLYCSEHNDTLKVIDFAYNTNCVSG